MGWIVLPPTVGSLHVLFVCITHAHVLRGGGLKLRVPSWFDDMIELHDTMGAEFASTRIWPRCTGVMTARALEDEDRPYPLEFLVAWISPVRGQPDAGGLHCRYVPHPDRYHRVQKRVVRAL